MRLMNLMASSERLAINDRAVAIRTAFMLRSSEAAAIEILNERPVIALDDEAWGNCVAALDAPLEIDPSVKARYARSPQGERQIHPNPSRPATTSSQFSPNVAVFDASLRSKAGELSSAGFSGPEEGHRHVAVDDHVPARQGATPHLCTLPSQAHDARQRHTGGCHAPILTPSANGTWTRRAAAALAVSGRRS